VDLSILRRLKFPEARRRRARSFLPLFVALWSSTLLAASDPVRLWDQSGETVANYDYVVRGLRPGTQVQLRDEQIVTLGRVLGAGNTTIIFEIGSDKALRLPKGEGLSPTGVAYAGYMLWFYEGSSKVEASETPVVKVFREESIADRYLVVEKLKPDETLGQIFSLEDLVKGRITDPAVAARLERELLEDFAPKTWALRFVSDMRSEQILYTSRGWVMADMSQTVRFAKAPGDATVFSAMGALPVSWRSKIEKTIVRERGIRQLKGTFLDGTLAGVRRCMLWFQGAAAF
jgi:hypothetical protein